ncbi:MAG TPA: PA0069 family radical SAM protein [Planctomycetota bacterium]|nr:PA0069 family radical SAM protein [Planctomycetota bacterium]
MNTVRGRGAAENPKNRFEEIELAPDPEAPEDATSAPATRFYRDESKSVIATNESPDVGFSASLNPYRGCEHGCVYCYARPTHEYLGFSAGLDFETRIMVKRDAPALLRKELSAPSWKPQVVVMSGVTDCYQPVERRLRLTRGCLEVFAEFRNPVSIVTKNHLVTRDTDLLADLARHRAAAVFVSVTTLDGDLARAMEPRASAPARRLAAISTLAAAGVPVGVLIAPVIPGLTEHEIPAILAAAAKAGARHAGRVMLRLPFGVKELFDRWLERHEPGKRKKVLGRLRDVRGGRLNETAFGSRMRGEGPLADQIHQLFSATCLRLGISERGPELSVEAFRRPGPVQLGLFG